MTPSWTAPKPEKLHALAEVARERAYAPYSHFDIGAALVAYGGDTITAANVENASLGLSMCAERAAVFRAFAEGHRRFEAIAIAGPADDLPPCGACLQVLVEVAPNHLSVTFPLAGQLATRTLGELLLQPFRL